MIFVRPPDTGAQSLTSRRDPMFSIAVFFKIKSTIPWRALGLHRVTGIIDLELILCASRYHLRKIYKNGVVFTTERQFFPFVYDAFHFEVIKQIKLEAVEIFGSRKLKQVGATDKAFIRIHSNV